VRETSTKRKKKMMKMNRPEGSVNSLLSWKETMKWRLFTLGQSTRMMRPRTAMIHSMLLPSLPRISRRLKSRKTS